MDGKMDGKWIKSRAKSVAAEDVLRLYNDELAELTPDQQQSALRQTSEYEFEAELMHTLVADLEVLADDPAIDFQQTGVEINAKRRWSWAAIAASVVVAFVVGLGHSFDWGAEPPSMKRYITRIGEHKTVALPDGSMIDLNTNTEILVSMSDASRHVELRRGEAYFDIARDESAPFTIDAGARKVTVLGTAFNILRGDRALTVTISEGLVALHAPETENVQRVDAVELRVSEMANMAGPEVVGLTAGQVAEFDAGVQRLTVTNVADVSSALSWRTGILKFKAVPLYAVVEELNRYSGKPIVLRANSLRNQEVFAAIDVRELGRALSLLEEMLPVAVVRESNKILVVEKTEF